MQKVKNIINRFVTSKKLEGHPLICLESLALTECGIVPSRYRLCRPSIYKEWS